MTTELCAQEFIGGPKDGDANTPASAEANLVISNPTVGGNKIIIGRFRYMLHGHHYHYIGQTA